MPWLIFSAGFYCSESTLRCKYQWTHFFSASRVSCGLSAYIFLSPSQPPYEDVERDSWLVNWSRSLSTDFFMINNFYCQLQSRWTSHRFRRRDDLTWLVLSRQFIGNFSSNRIHSKLHQFTAKTPTDWRCSIERLQFEVESTSNT